MRSAFGKRWPVRKLGPYALVCVGWIGANVLALAAIDRYETAQLSAELGVSTRVVRQYRVGSITVAAAGSPVEVSLPYRLRPPDGWAGNRKVPLLVFLHGSGERGEDNLQQLRSAPSVLCDASLVETYPCAVLAPQCPAGCTWASRSHTGSETDVLQAVLQVIDEVLEDDERIDPDRVYLTGFSLGAFGVWELAATAPERFAAAVPIAGGGDTSQAHRLAHLPIWAVHGSADPVVDVRQSRSMIAAIRDAGGDPRFTELPGLGHNSWDVVFRRNSEVLDWMFQQRREPR